MSFSSEKRMNLTALKRVDSSITEILDHASQVALYKFNHKANEWEKTEIEGTLFVYLRSQTPQHGFIVMNRLSTQNLNEPITLGLEFQLQTPFLLYKNSNGQINGLWFYDRTECSRVEEVLNRLAENGLSLKRQRSASESDKKHQNHNNNMKNMNNGDILALLHQAQEEYDKQQSSRIKGPDPKPLLGHPLSPASKELIKPTPVRAFNGISSKETVSKEMPKSPVSLSLASLFANATQHQKNNNNMIESKFENLAPPVALSILSPPRTQEPFQQLQRLFSNPANTLEHIEKQQLNAPKEEELLCNPEPALLGGIRGRSRATSCSSQMGLCSVSQSAPRTHPTDLSLSLERQTSFGSATKSVPIAIPPPSSSLDATLMTPDMFEMKGLPQLHSPSLSPNFGVGSLDSLPQSLLSPLVFSSKRSPPCTSNGKLTLASQSTSYQGSRGDRQLPTLPDNECEDNVGSAQCNHSNSSTTNAVALTREQLRESLLYLLRNDDSFLNKIHEGYLASLKSHLARS